MDVKTGDSTRNRFKHSTAVVTKTPVIKIPTWLYAVGKPSLLFLPLFVLVPLVVVFAQEVPPAETSIPAAVETPPPAANTDSAPANTPDVPATSAAAVPDTGQAPIEESTPSSDTQTPPPDAQAAMSAGYTDPQGGNNMFTTSMGYQTIAPKIDQSTGALTQRIQLDIPPGRKGVQPDLALVYNSQQLEDSIVGYGWSISTPYIERLNKAGSERMYADNYFTSSISGELATTTSTSTPTEYRAKIDDGKFIRYFQSGNVWIAYDKSGNRYYFGTTTLGQLAATTTPSNIYRWMLEEIRDSNGNYVKFTYTRDGNQLYPSTITYTGNGTTDGPLTIDFTLATRPDPIISYKSGFRVVTYYRVSQIQAKVSGSAVRTYALGYTSGNNSTRSLLSSLTLTGTSNGVDLSLPATTFTYASTSASLAVTTDTAVKNSAHVVADVDGNGLNDKIISYGPSGGGYYQYLEANRNGTAFDAYTNQQWFSNIWATTNLGYEQYPVSEDGVRFVDVNGDSKPDVVQSLYDSAHSSTTKNLLYNAYATSTGFAWAATSTASTTIPIFSYIPSGSFRLATGLFGNVNGDGLVDYIKASADVGQVPYVGTGSGWADSSSFAPLHNEPGSTGEPAYNIQLVDINADGLDDWIETSWSNKQTIVCLNTGVGWTDCDPHYTIATSTLYAVSNGSGGSYYWDRGMRFMDVNGDGLVDFVRAYTVPNYTTASGAPDIEKGSMNAVWLNTGSGFATSTLTMPSYITTGVVNAGVWSGELHFAEYANWKDQVTSTIPKQDILTQINYPKGAEVDVSYANSTKSGANPELPISLLTVTSLATKDGTGNTQTIDYGYGGGKMYLAQGPRERKFAGFATTTESRRDVVITRYFNQGDAAQADIGEQTDGYAQIGKMFREEVYPYASTTPLRKTFRRYDSANYFGLTQSVSTSSTNTSLNLQSASTQYVTASDSSSLSVTGDLTIQFWLNPTTSLSGLNKHFVNKSGAGLDYSYIVYHTSSNNLDLVINPSNNAGIDKGVAWSPTTGAWDHIMVTYNAATGDAKFYENCSQIGTTQTGFPNNIKDSTGLLGLGINTDNLNSGFNGQLDEVRIWNKVLSASECSSNYQSEIVASSTLQGYWKLNSDYTDTSGNSNTLTAVNNPTFATSTPFAGGGIATTTGAAIVNNLFVYPSRELVEDFDSSGNHRDKATEYVYATTTGDLLITTEKGEVIGASDGTYTDTGSDTRTTTYAYNVNTGINLSVPSQKTVANNSGTRIAESKYTYDNQAFGTTTLGNLTKQEDWITGTWYASSTAAYNTYGLATTTTDQRGKVTTFTFDTNNMYVATSTNALAQTTGTTYDYASGQVLTTTDPNNLNFTNVYDPVGRITQTLQPDLTTPATAVTNTTYTYTDNVFPSKVQITKYNSAATSTDTHRYFDGLGRILSERQEAAGNNTYAVKDYVYNIDLRLNKESLPYFASSTTYATATSTTALFTNYTYDGLDRALTAVNAVGTTTMAYGTWSATTTDAKGNSKGYTKDAYGNLLQVTEKNGSSYYSTNYTYDQSGNLTKITDALSNIRNFTYDGLNRRLTAEDLHASGDATFATTTYAYDLFGNVASTTDAKGQIVNFTYDSLNRLLTEDYTGVSGTEISYTYDVCTYGKGRVCIASSTGAFATTTYNALGLVWAATTTISGTAYGTVYSYDRQGNPTSIIYPSLATVRYNFNAAGQIDSIEYKAATSTANYSSAITATSYAPTGAPSYRMYGSGVPATYTFDPNELYRLRSIIAGTVGTSTASTTNTYALNLQGSSSQYATASDSASLSPTGDLTLEMWINPQSDMSGLNRHLINKSTVSAVSYILYHSAGNGLNLEIDPAVGSGVDQGVSWTFPTNTWNHLMATYKASTGEVKFYINCVQQGATQTGYPNNIQDTTGTLKIGTDNSGTTFNGMVDDIRIWNKVKSVTECSNDYLKEIAASTTLKGYWKMDGNYFDSSNNGNSLTAFNNPTFNVNVPPFISGLDQTNAHQNATYLYDANGNVTRITDLSTTTAARITNYTYDDLNRLTRAQNIVATSTPYDYSYSYDALGNMTFGPLGQYSYTGSSYENPHAPVSIATSTGAGGGSTPSTSTPAYVQSKKDSTGAANVTLDSSVTTGNLIVVGVSKWNQFISSTTVSDNKGNTYYKAGEVYNAATQDHAAIFYAKNVTGGSSFTVSTGITDRTLAVHEYSGVATSSVFNKVASTTGSSASPSSGSVTTSVDNELAFGTAWSIGDGDSWTAGSGYTKRESETNNATAERIATEDKVVTTAGSVSATYSVPTSGDWAAIIATFKPLVTYSGGGGGTTTTSIAYDRNGNAITYGTNSYTWDYRNRLSGETHTNASSTNTYDESNQRMKQVTWDSTLGTTTTLYPNKLYSIISSVSGATTTATSTNYIYAGDTLIATIEQKYVNNIASGTPKTYFYYPDHLGSTYITTNASGTIQQTLDYYPYGAQRINRNTSPTKTNRAYIGQFQDNTTSLSYLQNRYMDNARGQFLSQDPSHLAVGDPTALKQITGQDQQMYLANPQQLNSYSYAQDNPLRFKDPEGKYIEVGYSFVIPGRSFSGGLRFDSTGVDLFMGGGVGFGASGGFEASWTPGVPLSHRASASTVIFGQAVNGFGGRMSKDLSVVDSQSKRNLPSDGATLSLVIGEGAGGGIIQEFSKPLSGKQKSLPTSLVQNELLSSRTYIGAPRQTQQTQAQNTRSSNNQSTAQALSSLSAVLSRLSSTLKALANK